MKQEKKFTVSLQCGHCGNQAPMEVVSQYSALQRYCDDSGSMEWDAGYIYELSKCPACSGIILRRYYWHDYAVDPSEIVYEELYPVANELPLGLPDEISKAYRAALKVRNIDANAYAVLLGRVLELVCVNRDATGDNLDNKLKNLSEKGEIPEKLVNVASGLRKLRNIGAHASVGELTEAEIPVLDKLTLAILDYVYSAPLLAREAESRLKKLKSSNKN